MAGLCSEDESQAKKTDFIGTSTGVNLLGSIRFIHSHITMDSLWETSLAWHFLHFHLSERSILLTTPLSKMSMD